MSERSFTRYARKTRWGKRSRYPSTPSMPSMGSEARPRRHYTFPVFPEGPEMYRIFQPAISYSDWENPPPGFVIGTTSKSEWVAYKAMDIVMKTMFGYTKDVRQPPFIGMPPWWGYQTPIAGGNKIRGGSVVDLTANVQGRLLLIRVVTSRFHIETDPEKIGRDFNQLLRLSDPVRGRQVVDVLERDLLGDKTYNGAVRAMWRAVHGTSMPNPQLTGTSRRIIPV